MSNACSPQEEYSIALDTLCIVVGMVWYQGPPSMTGSGSYGIESQPQRTKDMEFGEITFFHYNIVICCCCCCCRGQHINNNVAFHVSKEVFQRPAIAKSKHTINKCIGESFWPSMSNIPPQLSSTQSHKRT